MNKKILYIIVPIVLLAVYTVWSILSSRVEHPKYQVLKQSGKIELRFYEPQLVAQVSVKGQREEAINESFRILADYIFGNNIVDAQIEMTAPVQQSESTKISMTAPVQQQSIDNQWVVEFVMPSKYTLDTLPKPKNEQVSIIDRKPYHAIAIKFSGTASKTNLAKNLEKLNVHILSKQYKMIGREIYAFYNPPWSLPFLRRNEIMYVIEEP